MTRPQNSPNAFSSRLVQYVTTDPTRDYDQLLTKMQDLGGIRQGKYRVDCRLFSRKKMMDGYESQRLYMIQFSDKQDLAFMASLNEKKFPLATSGFQLAPHDRLVVFECGLDGAATICGLDIYALKMDAQFDGTLFTIGDFKVAVCIFKTRNNYPKGITIEMQYQPAAALTLEKVDDSSGGGGGSFPLMDEFQSLLGNSDTIQPIYDNWKALFDTLGLSNTHNTCCLQQAIQYVVAVINMRN